MYDTQSAASWAVPVEKLVVITPLAPVSSRSWPNSSGPTVEGLGPVFGPYALSVRSDCGPIARVQS